VNLRRSATVAEREQCEHSLDRTPRGWTTSPPNRLGYTGAKRLVSAGFIFG
jgi:hypothetical protein